MSTVVVQNGTEFIVAITRHAVGWATLIRIMHNYEHVHKSFPDGVLVLSIWAAILLSYQPYIITHSI